jgi:signal transduction histidine kinase
VPEGLGLDGLEVSPRARAWPTEGLPVVTSSDAHVLADIGRSCTSVFAAEPSFEELGRALRGEDGRRIATRMQDLSLHILDIVENALTASATRIEIDIVEETARDLLTLRITDNGKGMDTEMRAKALDPFFTTRTTRRVGLGLPLLAQAAREAGGSLELSSEPGQGTTVFARFQLSHPDRKPLGDMGETLRAILIGRPELDLKFEHVRDQQRVAALGKGRPHDKESKRG